MGWTRSSFCATSECAEWRTSSFCAATECAELARYGEHVHLRNSTKPGVELVLPADVFRDFVKGFKNHEFDDLDADLDLQEVS